MGRQGVHSTTLYYPLVNTPMIEPTSAHDGLPALTASEAADWMVIAARAGRCGSRRAWPSRPRPWIPSHPGG